MSTTEQKYTLAENEPYPSKSQAFAQSLCPRCRRGKIFHGSLWSRGGNKMYKNCSHCNLRYEREPGYFYVSMFISYSFSVAELVIACLGFYLITGIDDNFWYYMSVVAAVVILTASFNYRYSRVTLLYYLSPGLKFVPELAKKKPNP